MTARAYPPDAEIERMISLADRLGKTILVRRGGIAFIDKSKLLPANSPGGDQDADAALDELEQSVQRPRRAANDSP